jgi:hypothetical protein
MYSAVSTSIEKQDVSLELDQTKLSFIPSPSPSPSPSPCLFIFRISPSYLFLSSEK